MNKQVPIYSKILSRTEYRKKSFEPFYSLFCEQDYLKVDKKTTIMKEPHYQKE
jgi:hypothetical protein